MPSNTPNFGLYKKDPVADGNNTFNIQTMLNDNWDKLDAEVVKKGTGIAELVGGTLTARPNPAIVGRYYFAQDTGEIYLDTGTAWVLAAASQGDLTNLQNTVSTHLAETATVHGATSEATASKIALRDANGSIKVTSPTEVSHVMNISDRVSGSYSTGQTEKSNITIGYDFKYLLFVWVGIEASTSQTGVYVINRRLSSPTAKVVTVLSAESVTVSVDAELKVNVKNTSGANRSIEFTLIGLGV